jgi:hypothetical protein
MLFLLAGGRAPQFNVPVRKGATPVRIGASGAGRKCGELVAAL